MKSDLRNLVTMEENFLAENQKYTIDLGSAYHVSPANRAPAIHADERRLDRVDHELQHDAAVPRCSSGPRRSRRTREGAPACENGASSARPLP